MRIEERVTQLEEKVAELEGRVQAQPSASGNAPFKQFAADITKMLENGEITLSEARRRIGLEALADSRANELYQRVT